ncbi:hypothetical protein HOLleu_13274 [Holothuria leucospilota]|uniref:Uncharacterized protein n=1 Tax=Holothuria leucospilota TaxID=206669 RepID=A0A9Q1CCM6_HOLLE|nr:hypothetical protein HOLleu_13274 [Holothuria leucospilota]
MVCPYCLWERLPATPADLARCVLAELPQQVEEYFRMKGVHPPVLHRSRQTPRVLPCMFIFETEKIIVTKGGAGLVDSALSVIVNPQRIQ